MHFQARGIGSGVLLVGAMLLMNRCAPRSSAADGSAAPVLPPEMRAALAMSWLSPVVLSVQTQPACNSLTVAESLDWCGHADPISTTIATRASNTGGVLTSRVQGHHTARELHALALLDLMVPRPDTSTMARAFRMLDSAQNAPDASIAVHVDRAALLLQRYAATRHIGDLLTALDATGAAAARAPTSWHACWNHAVAMTWAGMRRTVPREWGRCIQLRGRVGQARRPVLADAAPAASDTGFASAAKAQWREASREYAWAQLLPQWSAQVLGGKYEQARETVTLLDSVATVLAPSGIDPSLRRLSSELADLHRDGTPVRISRTASAVRLYTWVRTPAGRQAPTLAGARVDSAITLVTESSVLHDWIMLEQALVAMSRGVLDSAAMRFAALHSHPRRLTTVFGKSLAWGEASVWMASGRTVESLQLFGNIERACATVALEDCTLGASAMGAQISTHVGDLDQTEQIATRTLAAMARAPTTIRHWTANYLFRNIAEFRQLGDAVHDIDMESLRLVAELARPDFASDILTLRIRADIDAGELERARAGVQALRSDWFPQMTRDMRDFASVSLLWFDAETLTPRNATHRVRLLDSAASLVMRDGNEIRRTPIRFARATARLAAGDTAACVMELDTLLRAIRARAGGAVTVFEAARLARVTTAMSHTLARIHRARGDARAALQALSGVRAARGTRDVPNPDPTIVSVAIRHVGDSAWVWTLHQNRWKVSVVPLAERTVHAALQLDPEALATMYDRVLRHQVSLVAGGMLCVDARGPLARLPWGALRDRQRKIYLIELTSIALVTDATGLCGAQEHDRAAPRVAIVDAAPRDGPRALRAAAREVATLTALWGTRATRVDASLGSRATMTALPSMQIAHFAGHAMLDAVRAERSYLSLPNTADSAITGAQISRADLAQVQLVILAACESSGGSLGALGGFDSLAGAFLGAGVKAVIGATWPVDDAPTATLMHSLHTALRDGLRPAAALRAAQLQALRSSDPRLNTPRVWSAFVTMGS